MAAPDDTVWEKVEKEGAEELLSREGHGLQAVRPGGVLPPEAHPSFDPVRHLTVPDPGPRLQK